MCNVHAILCDFFAFLSRSSPVSTTINQINFSRLADKKGKLKFMNGKFNSSNGSVLVLVAPVCNKKPWNNGKLPNNARLRSRWSRVQCAIHLADYN